MLKLVIAADEVYDESTESFYDRPEVVIRLEHSLVSLSKWESIHQKPFLSSTDKTRAEIFGYLKAMSLDEIDLKDLSRLSNEQVKAVQEYIDSTQSATTFGPTADRRGIGEIITSELIYYWMVAFNIPMECERWHLNRLFALIRICNIKNSPPKKMSRTETAARNRELNERRRAKLGTSG